MTRTVTASTIAAALRRVKAIPQLIDPHLMLDACHAAEHTWRDGRLNPLATLTLFLTQVLHGNTAINHLRHLTPLRFTASAYCQARRRILLAVFAHLLRAVTDGMFDTIDACTRWRGHRTFIIDGSTFIMPDTPAQMKHFGQPTGQARGCGFPSAHLLLLCDMTTGLIREVLSAPLFTHDLAAAVKLCPALRRDDLVIADRGFAGWAFFAVCEQRKVRLVTRAHQRLRLPTRSAAPHPNGVWMRLYALSACDQVIEWFKPKHCPRWMSRTQHAALPPSIIVRIIRYTLRRRGFRTQEVTLMTSLVDHERYPRNEIIALYGRRWEIETNIRHLKQTMSMRELHCRTVAGVTKELIVFALSYNLVRMAMLQSALTCGVDPQRISFIDALRALQRRAGAFSTPGPGPAPPPTPSPLLINPLRPGRHQPRAIKRRPPQRRLLRIPRAEARQRLQNQPRAA